MSTIVEFKTLRLSNHAKAKLRDRDIDTDELAQVLTHPQIVEPSMGRLRLIRDELCAVVAVTWDGDATVVTVLLRQFGMWTDEDARNRD